MTKEKEQDTVIETINNNNSNFDLSSMIRTFYDPENSSYYETYNMLKSKYPEKSEAELLHEVSLLNPSQTVFVDEETDEHQVSVKGYHLKETGRLEDGDLICIAQQDPEIASIITTRIAQITVFAQEANSMFDRGIKIIDKDSIDRDDFNSNQEFDNEIKKREKEKREIFDWLCNCGTDNKEVINSAYNVAGRWHRDFTLKDYFQSQARNLLVCGRMARENIWSDKNELMLFRPLPVEQIKPAAFKGRDPISTNVSSDKKPHTEEKAEEYNKEEENERQLAFVQVVKGRVVSVYEEHDISVRYYQRQSNYNFHFYPLSPIEQSVATVFLNYNVNRHLVNKFKSGILARAMMVIRPQRGSEGITPKISPKSIKSITNALKNMGRTENSNAIPVLSGDFDVQMVDMNPHNDNEWLDLKNSIKRSLLSAFQISAGELSWGQLGDSSTMSQGNSTEEFVHGEERGLQILLDILIEDVNDILAKRFPEYAKKYKLDVQGVGAESKEMALQRMSVEQNLIATMNDLYANSDYNSFLSCGGDMPLNPMWHSNIVKYMTYGEIRENFFGEKNASKKPEYQFIVDPSLEQLRVARKTEDLQIEQQKLQLENMKSEMKMQQQQAQQQLAQQQQGDQQQESNQEQEMQKGKDIQERELSKSQSTINLWKKFNYNLDK